MDRCRCEDYAAAVKKLKFYTVGTHRPDIIDNYDRSEYITAWLTNNVSHTDRRFMRPKVWKKLSPEEQSENQMSERSQMIEQMWCPFMTPFKLQMFETSS